MAKFRIDYDDQLQDVVSRIGKLLKEEFGIEIIDAGGGDGFEEYEIIGSRFADPGPDVKPKNDPNKLFTPSDEFSKIIGEKQLTRTDAVKKLWEYIKANGLQDKKNRRMINLDAKMKAVIDNGKDQVSMFELAKYITNHLK